jgi:acetoin utilization deacetylase AcuC-like enzyme
MPTGLVTHDDYLLHDNGPLHPERPQRLRAVWSALAQTGLLPRLTSLQPRSARPEEVARVHDPRYIQRVAALAADGGGPLDPDTTVSPESYRIALLSAGGVLTALEAVLDGQVDNAFALTRPPGHHACHARGMGFCLFNNIAIAARAALAAGLSRVFILDWDVHHGNGTQEAFYRDPDVFFCSLHQAPWYPFTGDRDEIGEGPGEGATLNFPLPAGRRDRDYLRLLDEAVASTVARFRPELLLVSAGMDTHERDPLGQMRVSNEGFGAMAMRVVDWAERVCEARVVVCLEGGYDLKGLAGGVVHVTGALLGDALAPPTDEDQDEPPWSPPEGEAGDAADQGFGW